MNLTRRTAREWAIQMLTAADLNPPDDIPSFIEGYWVQISDLDEDDCCTTKARGKMKAFAEQLVTGVLGSVQELDEILVPLLDHWDLYRLGTVERSVLRMGIWEMKNTEVPKPVAINEAIDLTNWFSSPKSRTLVNGVLDKYAKIKG